MTPRPVVIDTDIGTDADDALALAFAALHPGIDLRAVTTVNGPVRLRARIARAVLAAAGRADVPVACGRALPLDGSPHPTMPLVWGHEGDGIALAPEPGSAPADEGAAAGLLAAVLVAADEPVTLCCIGALTNVADLVVQQPDLLERVAAVHVMGGCLGPVVVGGGQSAVVLPPWSETNFGCDPQAARVVLASGVPVRLHPVDVTMPLAFTDADRGAIAAAGPLGTMLGALMQRWVQAVADHRPDLPPGEAKVRLHDPLTVATVVDPGLATWETVHLSVEGQPGRVVTERRLSGHPVLACRSAAGVALRQLLVTTLTRG